MGKIISFDPNITKFEGMDGKRERTLHETHVYRTLTCWLAAVLIERGTLHISKEHLDAAIAHLESCAERPSFRMERLSDGCEMIDLMASPAN